MSLRQKQYVQWALLGVAIVLVYIGELADSKATVGACVVLIAVVLVLNYVWIRCPHCGTWLGREKDEYCRNCGKMIDWKAKKHS